MFREVWCDSVVLVTLWKKLHAIPLAVLLVNALQGRVEEDGGRCDANLEVRTP